MPYYGGPKMDYKSIAKQLTGRDKAGRWLWDYTWITRERKKTYVLQTFNVVGWPGLMEWHPDGSIIIHVDRAMCFSDRRKINHYLPHPYVVFQFLSKIFIKKIGDPDWAGKRVGNRIVINKDGKITSKLGQTVASARCKYQKQYAVGYRPRRRGQYWVQRVRNLYHDTSKCEYWRHPDYEIRIKCKARSIMQYRNQGPTTFQCGCRTYRKNIGFEKSVQEILEEPNATVRTAWIQLYGIEKFFKDAGAQIIHKHGTYDLMRLQTGLPQPAGTPARHGQPTIERRDIIALKMVCPSTGQTYVQTVPNNITSVHNALNWIYNVPDYLSMVGKQT